MHEESPRQSSGARSGGVKLGLVAPHPPLLIPEIGRGHLERVKATVRAMEEAAAEIREAAVEAVVLISPHGPVFRDAVAVVLDPSPAGDFRGFGARARFAFTNDLPLAEAILAQLAAAGIGAVGLDPGTADRYGLELALDHGALVPLYFLQKAGVDVPVVPLGMALLPPAELRRVGQAIRAAAEAVGRTIALVASGDLSHRLTPDAPAGFDPAGREFDRRLVALLRRGDVDGIATIDEGLREAAGECGYRSFLMMLGAFDGGRVETKVLSYEGPFGVGYCVALVYPPTAAAKPPTQDEAAASASAASAASEVGVHPFVALAREAITAYVKEGAVLSPPDPLPPEFNRRAAVFVSLHKFGELRGCIGTTAPTEPDLARQIIRYAICAATEDPRFPPVEEAELADLDVSVDVLTPPEPVRGPGELDPRVYGVIVRRGARSGLLLPDLEGVDTVEEQLDIARRKAGIGPGEPVELFRFKVVRYH
ncbi:MAG: AmmeMemoRadiSam system protein A [Bacillota bacterium]|nr:AmmeMemoRadiSam system protein A [Bacillota bacterium]